MSDQHYMIHLHWESKKPKQMNKQKQSQIKENEQMVIRAEEDKIRGIREIGAGD